MFCHKCGVQIAEGSAFCHKCGTKVVYEETSPQLAKQGTVSTAAVASIPVHFPNIANDKDSFKAFVDSHLQATTQFQSVEELINNITPELEHRKSGYVERKRRPYQGNVVRIA